jgi:hypothetical protein
MSRENWFMASVAVILSTFFTMYQASPAHAAALPAATPKAVSYDLAYGANDNGSAWGWTTLKAGVVPVTGWTPITGGTVYSGNAVYNSDLGLAMDYYHPTQYFTFSAPSMVAYNGNNTNIGGTTTPDSCMLGSHVYTSGTTPIDLTFGGMPYGKFDVYVY